MKTHKNPFFKLEDFQCLEILIEGTNVTSQVSIPGAPASIRLIEIHEDGLNLELPARCCAMGHTLAIDVNVKKIFGKSDDFVENKIHILGMVEEIETSPNSTLFVRLKFRQYAQEHWSSLLDYFSEKQLSVNKLIKNTRK